MPENEDMNAGGERDKCMEKEKSVKYKHS